MPASHLAHRKALIGVCLPLKDKGKGRERSDYDRNIQFLSADSGNVFSGLSKGKKNCVTLLERMSVA